MPWLLAAWTAAARRRSRRICWFQERQADFTPCGASVIHDGQRRAPAGIERRNNPRPRRARRRPAKLPRRERAPWGGVHLGLKNKRIQTHHMLLAPPVFEVWMEVSGEPARQPTTTAAPIGYGTVRTTGHPLHGSTRPRFDRLQPIKGVLDAVGWPRRPKSAPRKQHGVGRVDRPCRSPQWAACGHGANPGSYSRPSLCGGPPSYFD